MSLHQHVLCIVVLLSESVKVRYISIFMNVYQGGAVRGGGVSDVLIL